MKRNQKLTLLTNLINGQPQQLHQLKQMRAPWYMVVTNNRPIRDDDLVEARVGGNQTS